MQNANPSDDHTTVSMLQNLLFMDSKPKQLQPIDIALVSYLILRRTADHSISDSQQTLAERLGCERKAVGAAIERLDRIGWITATGRGRGRTLGLSINIEQLPAARSLRERLSPEAHKLAGLYMSELQRLGRRKFPKNWGKRQIPSAQRIISKCGGDLGRVSSRIQFAMDDKLLAKRARTSLYHLNAIWRIIEQKYAQEKGGNDVNHSSTAA